ncbi:MAG TPA: arabinofuranosidase catalytic domain-containing protein, partial [Ktedonobacteraceae bacterium]|nr:arabinofuranosidase catalytic domain-containing protein [Ktedonobacteraceae bacterium]
MKRSSSRRWSILLALLAVVGLIAGTPGFASTPVRAAGSQPCDIYAAGGTPCVAAHSTIRALF